MDCLLPIVEPPGQRATCSEAEGREAYAVTRRFADRLNTRGKLALAQALTSKRQRLQVRAGTVIDGPFA